MPRTEGLWFLVSMQPTQLDGWSNVGSLLLVGGVIGQLILSYAACLLYLLYLLTSCVVLPPFATLCLMLLLQGPLLVGSGWLWLAYFQPSLDWYVAARS